MRRIGDGTFTDQCPVPSIQGGMAVIDVGPGHPRIITPIAVLRMFNHRSAKVLSEHDAAEQTRVVAFKKGEPGH